MHSIWYFSSKSGCSFFQLIVAYAIAIAISFLVEIYHLASRLTFINTLCPVHHSHLFLGTTSYRMEGNFGGWKHWRIWRMTINSPKFLQPKYFVQY